MPKNYCIMQIWAESGKSALPICNYSQILYQFLTFTQNLKRSPFNRLQGVYATLRNFLLQLLGSASAFLGNLYLQKTDRFLIVYFSRSVLSNTSQSE